MDYTWVVAKLGDGPWQRNDLYRNDVLVARIWWAITNQYAEIHADIMHKSPSVFRKVRDIFKGSITEDVRAAGGVGFVATNGTNTVTLECLKYWAFMGFTTLITVEPYKCGIMEI